MSAEAVSVRVRKRRALSGGVVALELAPINGAPLPAFCAGAHVDVETKAGIVRQYSLCGDPAEMDCYRLGVLNEAESRGGSRSIHDDLREGDAITISAPKNHFPLVEHATHSVLVGGGIGITPLISMAYSLNAAGRSFTLHYCVADEGRAAFLELLRDTPFVERVYLHCSRSDAAPKFDPETDIPGWLDGYHLYTCGPAGFMDWVLAGAEVKGYADKFRHKEDFGADVDLSGESFTVEARRSNVTVEIGAGQTIAGALADAGLHIYVSCEEGVCGTCLTDVLEGVPDHRDVYLTDEERAGNNLMLVCCSRAKTAKLVLDL